MNNFWNLVGFEYKKILLRKSFLLSMIGLGIAFLITMRLGIVSTHFYHYPGGNMTLTEAMKADKAVISSKAGEITPELVDQAIAANKEMKQNDENYLINVIYEKNTENLSTDGASIVSINKNEAIDSLSVGDGEHFYKHFSEFMIYQLNQEYLGLSEKEVAENYSMMQEIPYPLYNDYYGGYDFYIKSAKEIAIIVLFVIVIVLAPLFGEEYHRNTHPLLLASKNGKTSLCRAKLFVAFSTGLAMSMLTMGSFFWGSLLMFGFEGGNVNIQVINPTYTYPMTLLEACLIHMVIVEVTAVSFSFFIAWLSANAKRSVFSLEAVATLTLVLPMFIYISPRVSHFLNNIINLFPANAITFRYVPQFYNVFGKLLARHEFIPMFSLGMTAVFGASAIYRFLKSNA